MNDLRHDQEAADAATHARLRDVWLVEAGTSRVCAAQVLTPDELRTVPMPELRSPAARELDADARDLRTADQRHSDDIAAIHADLELLWGAVTALLVEREKGRVHD